LSAVKREGNMTRFWTFKGIYANIDLRSSRKK